MGFWGVELELSVVFTVPPSPYCALDAMGDGNVGSSTATVEK
ncbi:hypothetical protein ACP4OV_009309 [Aristida adscensionis]